MNKEQLEALKNVVEYYWDEEERSYDEYEDVESTKQNHIFNDLVELKTYLDNAKAE